MTPEAELLAMLAQLGPDERAVVLHVARRLAMGARAYGPLDIQGDRRSWRHEAAEELLDACVYLTCETMRTTPKNVTNMDNCHCQKASRPA